MPQYLSPGVYVEEVPSAVQPIAGVGTSTAGFIGASDFGEVETTIQTLLKRKLKEKFAEVDAGREMTRDDAQKVANKAVEVKKDKIKVEPLKEALCTNFSEFTRAFGGFSEDDSHNLFAHAVYGFFINGGTRCWVERVNNIADAGAVGKALDKFNAIDEVAIVAVPGAQDKSVQNKVIEHCEKIQDRFAIIDGQHKVATDFDKIKGKVKDSSYAAIYYPWLGVYDPIKKEQIFVPPSGHLAGIYARVDQDRGVHKAPANEGVLGALDVEIQLSKNHQAGLNPKGINVIRKFNGNIRVWGARTIGGDDQGEWKYINVRRLFLYLRKSIDQSTQWVVFEPNDMGLWAKITRNVTAFLTNVWRDGALFGSTPQEAFYVKCDEETNPPEVRDQGQVVTEIGVAVVKPAEFVIFRISQWAGPGGT